MKKVSIFIVLVLIVAAIAASCNKEDKLELGFDITLPSNWVGYMYSEEGYVYDARRVPLNESDTLVEGLVVYKNHLPEYTLSQYYSTIRQQINQSEAYDSLTYATDTTINFIDFKKMVSHELLTYVNPDYNDTVQLGTVTERYFFFADEYGYNLTFVAIDSLYPSAKPSFDAIIHSFKYKN